MVDADYLYACDPKWWRHHNAAVVKTFHGERWTQQQEGKKDPDETKAIAEYGLNAKPGRHLPGLGRDCLHYGQNSGYQAINLAYLFGANRILLLGYDMQMTGGKRHYFGEHPGHLSVGSAYNEWVPQFTQLAADLKAEGVEVTNCTRSTALRCFPRMTINEFTSGA